MKSTKQNKTRLLWLSALSVYVLALLLLVLAERTDPDASIRSFSDAIWYSLVTVSTVGYGDLYPVTPLGRILGAAFVLMSVGVLTFVISLMIRMVTGKMLPALRLFQLRKRHWFVFSDSSDCSRTLLQDLSANHPDAVFLFPDSGEVPEGTLAYPGTPESVAARKKDGCSLFFLGGEDAFTKAIAALELGHPVYCQTAYAPDSCPEGLTLFNRYDCCAQSYWNRHGISQSSQTILLIGDGNYARYLLDRALHLNVFAPDQQIHYHVFGNWDAYRKNHYRLSETIGLEGEGKGDQLIFHTDSWNSAPELLAQAHRILICQDDIRQNLPIVQQLRQYFPITAAVHILYDRQIPGETVFGTNGEVFTEELVMRHQQSFAARCMHELYRDSVPDAPRWEELSEFLRQSNIAAADHLLIKVRLLLADPTIPQLSAENCKAAYLRYRELKQTHGETFRWIEHHRWMRLHSLYNWRYGPQRDNPARIHPMMRPYEQLEPSEQQKDDYAWELLEQLANKLD